MAGSLNPRALDRPIRVVLFGGAYFEPAALRFLLLIQDHAEIEFVGAFCQGSGRGVSHRVINVLKRRGPAALAVLCFEAARAIIGAARHPIQSFRLRRRAARAMQAVEIVPDIHAPDVIARVRALVPDLGLIYGSPVLRPVLFEIPAFGTLGIHHGKLPQYRGKKTTFWAMHNGDRSAGVTIQKINDGLDRGEIVREGDVPIGTKGYRTVESEVEDLGLKLYLDSILAIKRGKAKARPQPAGKFPLYRQPSPRDIIRYVRMRAAMARLRTGEIR
jgi:folate-dependent phosphoribosylglycinamide formyltransferase PurN